MDDDIDAKLAAGEPLARYEVNEANTKETRWTLSLYPEFFRVEKPGDESHDVPREEVTARVQTIEKNLFLKRAVVVKIGRRQRIFKLSPEAFEAITGWIGPPTMDDLKFSLKRRFAWIMPIGLLFVLTALPIGGLPGDPVILGLGIGLVLTGALAKLRPHRVFFALDSLWFTFLATTSAVRLIREWNSMMLVFLLIQLSLVTSGWKEYARFAPSRMAAEENPEPEWGEAE